ncbi:hypothetical protein [Micromonospora palomenae]|nr:hypothetical protein [Micromonospora palomenae]
MPAEVFIIRSTIDRADASSVTSYETGVGLGDRRREQRPRRPWTAVDAVLMAPVREANGVAESKRRRLAEDDLLKGFDQTGPGGGRLGGFFAITIGASLYAWHFAFSFGAYHTVLYYFRQQLFVVSLVVLLGGLIMRSRMQIHPWLLALFTPWLLLTLVRLVLPAGEPGALPRVVDRILLVATVVVLPIIAWVVARLLAPNYFTLPDRRSKIAVVAIVAVVTITGYSAGRWNDRFLTCGDFQVAGDDEPKNCSHVPRR